MFWCPRTTVNLSFVELKFFQVLLIVLIHAKNNQSRHCALGLIEQHLPLATG